MVSIQLRPRFRITTPLTITELTDRLRIELQKEHAPFAGKVLREFAVLRILPKNQHFWSPELTLQLHAEHEGTLIRGLFGPHPALWTMFACFYTFAIFISLIALIYGLSQWSLGMETSGFWLLPIPIVPMICAYITALIGQRLGHAQMEELYHFLEQVLATETAPTSD